ncbi:unnamed protein product [Didymodactylos carnosus]|uniref:Tetratricopeptide repeat protein n=1 Tax=Didymodactylos carnosus TaxID=1234261 RepID=A0A815SYU1_9BILA|nr:unnamed protein product [Didymodactylos carnosus]CAF0781371.1 unnamed protein product [Didymodactylos carnosus]CAF1499302.1 unnamed protein product [Didymodactylos carnosus]CAF3562987.1 unnamed protein product [Didymodactylos carnosus]CAF3563045.1 unnamed protein product [Didymodactylos carnosus]
MGKGLNCLDEESKTFLLFQLLTFLFHERQHDTTEINDFENVTGLYNEIDISNPEQTYLSKDKIWWYTNDAFISRLLDEALRTKNISLIFKLRYIIINLLDESYEQNLHTLSVSSGKILTLYREECITNEKLIKLKLNINRLLSINTFYSTTFKKPTHILQPSESSNMKCVLFQIDIDISKKNTYPFFIINNDRLEILFTFGTVFQIHSVELDTNTQIWNVKLIINDDVEKQVMDLIKYLGDEYGYPFDFMVMGDFLDDIGKYDKAIECYKIFLDETSQDDKYIPMAYNHLGLSYYHNKSYAEALENYYKALMLYRSNSPYDQLFVDIYTLIGKAFYARNQYSIAIDYYKEAINIKGTLLPTNGEMNYLYHSIGEAYSQIGDEQKYREYNAGRPIVISVGSSNSVIYPWRDLYINRTINYTTSLGNFQDLLTHLLNNKSSASQQFDYDIATLLYKMGEIYFKMKQYEQALEKFEKAVDVYLNVFPLTLSNLARNYDTITDSSILILKDYLIENEYYFRMIPLRYSLLAQTYYYIARVYSLERSSIMTAISIHKLATAIKLIQQDY